MPEHFKFDTVGESPIKNTQPDMQTIDQKLGKFSPSMNGSNVRKAQPPESVSYDSLPGWVRRNIGTIETTEGRL